MILDNVAPVTVALMSAAGSFLLLCLVIGLWMNQRRLLNRYRLLLGGPRGRDLESVLLDLSNQVTALKSQVAALDVQTAELGRAAKGHIQYVGIVRYRAFPELGSDLSFSAALLDGNRNGLVVTSLFGRSESRIYGKPVQSGTSTYILTDEEKQAIAEALASHMKSL